MNSDWDVFVEDNEKNRGQKYPFWKRTEFNSGSINLFIAICDYNEENKKRRRTKRYPTEILTRSALRASRVKITVLKSLSSNVNIAC